MMFDTEEAAAIAFSKAYVQDSYENDWEWFAYIVKVEDKNTEEIFYTYTQVQHSKKGNYQWSPEKYDYDFSSPEQKVAEIHTHPTYTEYAGDSDLRFSNNDMSFRSVPLYLANQAGELLKYDPYGYDPEDDEELKKQIDSGRLAGDQIFLICDDLPTSVDVPEELTGYHPFTYERKEHNWFLYYINPFNWGSSPVYYVKHKD